MTTDQAIERIAAAYDRVTCWGSRIRTAIVAVGVASCVAVFLCFAPIRERWNGESPATLTLEEAWKVLSDESADKDKRVSAAFQLRNIACRASYALWQAEASTTRPVAESSSTFRKQVLEVLAR